MQTQNQNQNDANQNQDDANYLVYFRFKNTSQINEFISSMFKFLSNGRVCFSAGTLVFNDLGKLLFNLLFIQNQRIFLHYWNLDMTPNLMLRKSHPIYFSRKTQRYHYNQRSL